MDASSTPLGRGTFRRFRRKRRLDYTQRPVREDHDQASAPSFSIIEAVRAVGGEAVLQGTAFQSMVVAALQALDQACYHERRVATAAISLAQRQKLAHMLAELEATADELRQMLSQQGATMVSRMTAASTEETRESSWWFTLCEALHVLDEGTSGLRSTTAGQPRNSTTRAFSTLIAGLLERHYNTLFVEAEQWLG